MTGAQLLGRKLEDGRIESSSAAGRHGSGGVGRRRVGAGAEA